MAGITHRGAPRVERNRYGSAAGQQRWSKPPQALSSLPPNADMPTASVNFSSGPILLKKVHAAVETKFFRAADAFNAVRRGGPRRLGLKVSATFLFA